MNESALCLLLFLAQRFWLLAWGTSSMDGRERNRKGQMHSLTDDGKTIFYFLGVAFSTWQLAALFYESLLVAGSVAGNSISIARPSLHCVARATSPLSSPNAAYCCALLSRHCHLLFGFATVANISQSRERPLLQDQKNGTFTSGTSHCLYKSGRSASRGIPFYSNLSRH